MESLTESRPLMESLMESQAHIPSAGMLKHFHRKACQDISISLKSFARELAASPLNGQIDRTIIVAARGWLARKARPPVQPRKAINAHRR